MAELLKNNQSKRRLRSSTSSTSSEESSSKSPLQKRSKNIDEEGDAVMAALNMAEDMSSKLEEILSKVSKLDVISESVQKIEKTMLKLEERTTTLEIFQKSVTSEIEDLKQSNNFLGDQMDSEIKKVKGELHTANTKIKELSDKKQVAEDKLKNYEEQIDNLKTKDLYLEAYSRRENIKFINIEEDADEVTEEKLRSFLRDELEYQKYDSVEIQRIHRNGKKFASKPRPILVRFLRYKDCEEMLALGRNLKGTEFQMFSDLPYEIIQRRRLQMTTYKKAKLNKIPVSFSKSEPDKLYIRGKVWPIWAKSS